MALVSSQAMYKPTGGGGAGGLVSTTTTSNGNTPPSITNNSNNSSSTISTAGHTTANSSSNCSSGSSTSIGGFGLGGGNVANNDSTLLCSNNGVIIKSNDSYSTHHQHQHQHHSSASFSHHHNNILTPAISQPFLNNQQQNQPFHQHHHSQAFPHHNKHTNSSNNGTSAPVPGSDNGAAATAAAGAAAAEFTPDRPIGYGAFGVVWSVTDPRSGKRVALKKMPNVFQNLASCKRVFREIKMLATFKHDNVLSCLDILQPPNAHFFQELYVLTELMQSDLHKIIVSPQTLTSDHVKVFVYQLLRGVKYLHSANILHRDIKPGNLLVNSNCILKICDFGLARVWEEKEAGPMTHEVVTQYYRAPELLMGARRYTTAIDVWSVGCIFAELLGRRILFQAQGPIEQLNLIVDLLGTPSLNEMKYACEGAKNHVLRAPYRPPNLMKMYSLSQQATHDAVHLLSQMLVFNPDKRISLDEALSYSYLDEGRMRFHSCMCSCCYTTAGGQRIFTNEFDQTHPNPLSSKWERELSRQSMFELRDKIYTFVTERPSQYSVPLCINPNSVAFKRFTSSSVAQPSELPPSPLAWD